MVRVTNLAGSHERELGARARQQGETSLNAPEDSVSADIARIGEEYELGFNDETHRIGILFPPWLADMRAQPNGGSGEAFEGRNE